jgi:hypothetical protein
MPPKKFSKAVKDAHKKSLGSGSGKSFWNDVHTQVKRKRKKTNTKAQNIKRAGGLVTSSRRRGGYVTFAKRALAGL